MNLQEKIAAMLAWFAAAAARGDAATLIGLPTTI